MGAWGFVFLAYGIVWGAILIYWFTLKRRLRRAETELAPAARIPGVTDKCLKRKRLYYWRFDHPRRPLLHHLRRHAGGHRLFRHAVGVESQGTRFRRQVFAHGRHGGQGIAAKRRAKSHLSLQLDRRQPFFQCFSVACRPICSPKARAQWWRVASAADGVFQATTIMAKHAEEYSPHVDGKDGHPKSFVPAKEADSSSDRELSAIFRSSWLSSWRSAGSLFRSSPRAPAIASATGLHSRRRSSANSF